MRVVVVTPAAPVITAQQARVRLRVDDDADDALIEDMIEEATAHLDGPDGWLGRALGMQTLEARCGADDCLQGIALPCPPIVAIASVSWLDRDRVVRLADPRGYELVGDTLDVIGAPAWCDALPQEEALRIRYVAGYAVLPPAIRAAILLMVGDLYRNRETSVAGVASEVPMSTNVAELLAPLRVWA